MRSSQETRESMDPLKVAANVAGLMMENDRVRVMHTIMKPNDKAAMHTHPDHVIYVLKGGKVQLTDPSGKVNTMELETGEAVFMEAQSHEVVNLSDDTLDFVLIEIK